jgi:hypothetical protein
MILLGPDMVLIFNVYDDSYSHPSKFEVGELVVTREILFGLPLLPLCISSSVSVRTCVWNLMHSKWTDPRSGPQRLAV